MSSYIQKARERTEAMIHPYLKGKDGLQKSAAQSVIKQIADSNGGISSWEFVGSNTYIDTYVKELTNAKKALEEARTIREKLNDAGAIDFANAQATEAWKTITRIIPSLEKETNVDFTLSHTAKVIDQLKGFQSQLSRSYFDQWFWKRDRATSAETAGFAKP